MTDSALTVRQVAQLVDGTIEGDASVEIARIASLESAGPGELTFALDAKRAGRLADSKAAAAIVDRSAPPAAMPLIRVANVNAAVAKLLGHLGGPEDLPPVGIHPSAAVAPDADVSPQAAIGPGVSVGARAKVAAGAVLCANVAVGTDTVVGRDTLLAEGVVVKSNCRIGERVRIGPNSVIGSDGFGYYFSDGQHHKIPHIGTVVIEDDVEIGACSCVDRAKFGTTLIGAGTKIDNLVQVAHNVQIGRGCILAGQCGIAGSAKLGNQVVIMGHSGIRDNVSIGDGVQCAAFAAVASDVPDGEVIAGIPAGPAKQMLRIIRAGEKVPELLKRVRALEAKLEGKAIESSKDN